MPPVDLLDFIPVAWPLSVLLVGLWGQGWRKRARAAEATMAQEDKLRYDKLKALDARNAAAQERAAAKSVREALEVQDD